MPTETDAMLLPNHSSPASAGVWRVGTLKYNYRSLINVFFWMLWGDFCLQMMDSGVAPNLLTIQLSKQGATNATILFIGTTVVQIMQMVMVPIVSTWSDRHRGRLGRRMPFMLYTAPLIAIFLIALGFSPQIAGLLRQASPRVFGVFSLVSLTVALIALFNTTYQFFDGFPQSVYYYLWPDVIPPQLMGTFACLFRVFSTAGVFVFNRYLLKYCDDHAGAVCIGAGLLYMVTFMLLCFMIKEGEYPPPDPRLATGGPIQRFNEAMNVFARECYSHAFYWKIYIYNLCFMLAFVPCARLLIRFADVDLHITHARFGQMMSWRDLAQIPVYLCLGPIIDRFHPVRAGFFGYLLLLISSAAGFFLFRSEMSFAVCIIFVYVSVAVYQGALGALGPRLLPKEKYGQFCAANSMVWHLGLAAGAPLCGLFIDRMGAYRWMFAWFFLFTLVGMFMMWLVYRDWQALGGDDGYVAPGTALAGAGFDVIPTP